MRIALTGNPNSGKTTMYNALTGRSERVGNWAGVTVEKKEHPVKKVYSGNEDIVAVDRYAARSRRNVTGDDVHRRALARTVAAQESQDFALLDSKGGILYGILIAVPFGNVLDFNHLDVPLLSLRPIISKFAWTGLN